MNIKQVFRVEPWEICDDTEILLARQSGLCLAAVSWPERLEVVGMIYNNVGRQEVSRLNPNLFNRRLGRLSLHVSLRLEK